MHYVTALGTDSFSEEMLTAWQQENIQTDLIQRMDNKLPGLYFIETDESGERTFYYWRNDAAARFWLTSPAADDICQRLETFDYLYLSGISLAILDSASRQRLLKLLRACRAKGGKVILITTTAHACGKAKKKLRKLTATCWPVQILRS